MDVDVRHPIMHSMPPIITTYIQYIFICIFDIRYKLQQNSKFPCWSQTNPFSAFDFPYIISDGLFSQAENVLRTLGLGPKSRLWGGLFSSVFDNINIMIWSHSLPLIAKGPSYSLCRICFGRLMNSSSYYYYACRISFGGGICRPGRFCSTNEGK
jgi:hypothetical protein